MCNKMTFWTFDAPTDRYTFGWLCIGICFILVIIGVVFACKLNF